MEIDLDNRTERPIDGDHWTQVLTAYLREMGLPDDTGVSVSFVTDAEIQILNQRYRDIDAPTDVLSFSAEEGEDGTILPPVPGLPRYLGDIILSVETVSRQAVAQSHSWDREAAVLLAHGVLHLLGYDHVEPDETAVMFAKQEALADQAASIS